MRRVSAYEIVPQASGEFTLPDGELFDVSAYSNMKYGDGLTGMEYGRALARVAIAETPDEITAEKVVVTVPGCVYAPKPAYPVALGMLTGVNEWRTSEGMQPARFMRMYSQAMGDPNYAQSSLAERQRERASHSRERHIPTSLVRDAVVYTVDDCVITGATEKSQCQIIEVHNPAEVISAPAITVDPAKAAEFPGIEHAMNMAANPNIDTVTELIRSGRFMLNSRVLKLILSVEDTERLAAFFDECPVLVRNSLYEATVNSTLEFVERYAPSVKLLQQSLYKAPTRKP